MYPLAQGYDSVMLQSDVELGGTDQLFNLLMGREMQRKYGQPPQIVLTMPIIEGLDGVQKMSKSLNNAIGVSDSPFDMFGKLMQVSDELMWRYWTLLTDVSQSDIKGMQDDVSTGTLHPMQAKKQMARTITAGFHGMEAAARAEDNWSTQYQKGGVTDDTERVTLNRLDLGYETDPPSLHTDRLLMGAGLVSSMSEARRKRSEHAVKVDGEAASEMRYTAPSLPVTLTVRLGKKTKLVTIE